MEKYIIILVILATIYYIQNKLQLTEGFEAVPAQTLGGVDDTNAINTLAQISKQLMIGGVTVPGNINIKDGILDIKPPGDWGLALSVTGGVKEAPYINFNNKADGKRNGFIMGAPDKFILANNVQVAGALSVDTTLGVGGSINLGGDITFLAPKTIAGKARLHIGGEELLYLLNKAGVIIGKEWGGNGNLSVQGNLNVGGDFILGAPIYRKHMPAGYFHIRAYGWRTPLYYGFNMMWNDHNIKEAIRAKWGWNESMFSNSIHDMRQAGDPNWQARYLVVFPGYKIKLYSWDGSFIDRIGVKGAGEYGFGDSNNIIHGAFVSLAEEGDPPERINW